MKGEKLLALGFVFLVSISFVLAVSGTATTNFVYENSTEEFTGVIDEDVEQFWNFWDSIAQVLVVVLLIVAFYLVYKMRKNAKKKGRKKPKKKAKKKVSKKASKKAKK